MKTEQNDAGQAVRSTPLLECHGDFGFVCPECGSHYWGTSQTNFKDWSTATGHCHDQNGVGCRYKWNRATGDDRVFKERCTCHQHSNNNGITGG